MLFQPVVEKLRDMRLYGMLSGMEEQAENLEYKKLSFDERLGLLVDREWSIRQDKRLKRRIKNARFKDKAYIEDLDFSAQRGLDRAQVLYLAQAQWITKHLIEDPTLADATMDRVVHNSYRIGLKGESMRKKQKSLTQSGH